MPKIRNFNGARPGFPGLALWLLLGTAAGHASTLSEAELREELEVFGRGFIIERIDAPFIDNPYDWISRRAGDYVYHYVESPDGELRDETEKHIPDPENPRTAWERHIGDELVEKLITRDERDVLIVEEVDHQHGFRIDIAPGVHLPAGIAPGDTWEIDAELAVYGIETGELEYEGSLRAIHSYEGAFRVRTPAGEFDTVLIREDFKARIGPLKAEDDRFLFYSRDVGLVAEIEGLKASALLVFRMREHSAKVLAAYPARGD